MSFQEQIKKHLSVYKKDNFPTMADGKWHGTGYPHILDKSQQNMNIIKEYRDSFFQNELHKIKLHEGFHHLNSSQAMCINFFFPLVAEKQLEIVLDLLGFAGESVNYSSAMFEKESSIDKSSKGSATSFDFYFETKSNKKFFFEIKYTEDGFGKANYNKTYRTLFDTVYKKHLKCIKDEYHIDKSFLKNYQLFRNLIHISDDQYVVLVYPSGNSKVHNESKEAKTSYITDKYKSNLFNVTWEKLLSYILDNITNENLLTNFYEFSSKYNILLKKECYSPLLEFRILDTINNSWELLIKKIGNGLIEINKEASLQLQYAYILKQSLELIKISDNEKIDLELETGCKIDGSHREIDILVRFRNNSLQKPKSIAIEMKCYKTLASSGKKRGAQDLFRFEVYRDLELLEKYIKNEVSEYGVSLVMTDHRNFIYPKSKETKSWAYNISDGHKIENGISLDTPIGGETPNIDLKKSYNFNWNQYGDFWFLFMKI